MMWLKQQDKAEMVLDFIVQILPQWDISPAHPSPIASTLNQGTFCPHFSWRTKWDHWVNVVWGEETSWGVWWPCNSCTTGKSHQNIDNGLSHSCLDSCPLQLLSVYTAKFLLTLGNHVQLGHIAHKCMKGGGRSGGNLTWGSNDPTQSLLLWENGSSQ